MNLQTINYYATCVEKMKENIQWLKKNDPNWCRKELESTIEEYEELITKERLNYVK